MKAKIRILLREGNNSKVGGVRQIYRHVDILNQLGYDAAVVHPEKGFRCSWFENNTKTIGFGELDLDENDCMVLPELDQDLPPFPGSDKCKVVVLAQNPFLFLRGFGGLRNLFAFYKSRVSAVICVSEHSRKHLQYLLPFLQVYRHIYSFDKPPFSLGTAKERMVAVMPRKRGQEIDIILTLLQQLGCLDGWKVVSIIDRSENEVADIMRRASIFMATGQLEGFGMPACFIPGQKVWTENGPVPIESISKGNVVVTHLGRTKSVLVPMNRAVDEEVVGIKLVGLYSPLRMTKEHPIWSLKTGVVRPDLVRRSLLRGAIPAWNQAGSLVKGDYVVVPKMRFPKKLWSQVNLTKYGYKKSKTTNHGSKGISSTHIAKDTGISRRIVQEVLGEYGREIKQPMVNLIRESANRLGWTKPENPSPVMPLNEDTGFLVGQYVSEGSCSSTGSIEFASHAKERDTRNALLRIACSVFGLQGSQKVKGNGGRAWVCCRPLATALGNLCGKGAYHKRLPMQLMIHNMEFARGVIRGAWMGDGCIIPEFMNWSYSTASEELALGMRQAMTLFGILPSVGKNRGDYVVQVSGRARILLSNLLALPAVCKKRTGQSYIDSEYGFLVPIRSVSLSKYSGPVYNMEVTDDSSYCVDGVAVHNCEAMASGCVVVGYHGYGGEEIFKPEFSRPVPDEDVFAYIEAMREVLKMDMAELNLMGEMASKYVRKEYSTKNEIESIKTAWSSIMKGKR